MATGTAGTSARELDFQAVHYLRKTVNFGDSGIASGLKFANPLPAGAQILFTTVIVTTAFNAGTTNVLTVGTSSGSMIDVVSAADVDESAVASTMALRGADLTFAADTDLYVKYTQTGGAATTGKATVIVAYVPNNDQ